MFSKIALTLNAAAILCAALVLGAPSAASAKEWTTSPAEIQKCVARLQATGHGGGGDDEAGTTGYDVLVGRCMSRRVW